MTNIWPDQASDNKSSHMTRPQTNACFQSPVQLLKQVLCATLEKRNVLLQNTWQRRRVDFFGEKLGFNFFWTHIHTNISLKPASFEKETRGNLNNLNIRWREVGKHCMTVILIARHRRACTNSTPLVVTGFHLSGMRSMRTFHTSHIYVSYVSPIVELLMIHTNHWA